MKKPDKKPYNKGVIFNADDYGPMKFLNQGIEQGIKRGVVNSVSAFATYNDQSMISIENLHQKYGKEIGIGLHFSITAGSPVGSFKKVKSLYGRPRKRKRRFRSIFNLNLRKIEEEEFEIELRLQLERLGKALGGVEHIDHLNSHGGFLGMIPEYWEIALRVAKDYNIALRSPATYEMRHTYFTYSSQFLKLTKSRFLPGFINLILHANTAFKMKKGNKPENRRIKQTQAEELQQPLPNYFIQSYYRQAHPNVIHKFLEDIKDQEVGEFMLHLGSGDFEQEHQRHKHWGIRKKSLDKREKELEVLLSEVDNIEANLKHFGISKINYRDII